MIPAFTAAASLKNGSLSYSRRLSWPRAAAFTETVVGTASSFSTGTSKAVRRNKGSALVGPTSSNASCSLVACQLKSDQIEDNCYGVCLTPDLERFYPWLIPLCKNIVEPKCAAEARARELECLASSAYQCEILGVSSSVCINGSCCRADYACGSQQCCEYGQTCCGSPPACADLETDANNCGACGKQCTQDQSCLFGVCVCRKSCPPGWVQDPDTCVCSCPQGQVSCGLNDVCCPPGSGCCGGECTPLDTPANCGACGKQCGLEGMICQSGQCVCASNTPDVCPSQCANLSDDSENCGICGLQCLPGQYCQARVCTCLPSKPLLCDSQCVDPRTDNSNCGKCANQCWDGQSCAVDTTGQIIGCENFATSCVSGACTCPADWYQCGPDWCSPNSYGTCCYQTLGIQASCPTGTSCVADPSLPLGFKCQ
jgi:hypothetical protein